MLAINWSDVWNVVSLVLPHLIAIVVALIVMIAVIVAVMKQPKPLKRLIRGEAGVAFVLVVLIVVNLMTGPLETLLTSVAGKPLREISEESTTTATELAAEIIAEGTVLLENEDNLLPLGSDTTLNVFGWASYSPVYGGTGSGSLNASYPTTTLIDGLNQAGISTNTELTDFYAEYCASRPSVGMRTQDWTLPEPNVNRYTDDMMANAQEFSDVAMVVIGRVGGEGADLPTDMMAVVDGSWQTENTQGGVSAYYSGSYDEDMNEGADWDEGDHFLQLSNREEDLLDLVCSNFENVIVLYNGANPFELGFVEDYPQIKSVLWCAGAGQPGFTGLGQVISGAANPSGKLIDTYVYDLTTTPTWNNFGNFGYTNMEEFRIDASFSEQGVPTFVNYNEGIYVGYKFYETAAAEGLINYEETVQYPFGYGMSYTSFTQEMQNFAFDGTNVTFDVVVTNTGSVAGKDVVEVYYNPPYTNGGIEKASANLIDFGKTGLLEPNASETISFSIAAEDLASYDYQTAGCYVLEAGDYVISINADSHTVLDSETFSIESTITYDENNKRESDQVAAVNQFDFARGEFTVLSRADGFANYDEATAAPTNFEMPEESKAGFYNISYVNDDSASIADEDPDAEPITTGADNGLQLVDLRGVAYDDPQWDLLLDQLTLEEMTDLIALGGYQTLAIESIGKYRTNDCDGPASINNNFTGQGSVGFPAGVMIAATWSKDIAYRFGSSIGDMANQMDTAGWYAPAMNIHRNAFAGRNFEYYSEDPVLSGHIASQGAMGAAQYGVYAYLKHFALNDQEGNRNTMLCTWADEQTIREIYLKPFEICVKDNVEMGGATAGYPLAIMSSFNYIGNRWTGGCNELCNVVLRDEWGLQGMVLTDYFGVYGYMNADQAIRNGTDFCLVNYETETSRVRFQETNGAQQAMRTATKNILYTVVNSRQYSEDGIAYSLTPNRWETIVTGVNIGVGVVLVAWEVLLIVNYMKRKKAAK